MRKLFPVIILMLLLSWINISGQISTRQAGVRLGYRSGFFYQVSSETGNAETGYNGIDGWLAAEYRIRDIPVIVSLNLKPYFEITVPAFVRLMPGDFGFSISYVF